ncbi:MAG: hypothetical protein H0W51_01620 [Euzebyales bacterium]|nr:hypothetical protein [Euzebyales bacterium]
MTTPTTDVDHGAPWYLRLGAWIGVGTAPGALMAGGGIAASTSGAWRLPAVVIGVVGLVTLAVLGGRQGFATRIPTVGLARRAFGGRVGERLVALFITVGVCGWCGIYIGVCAGALDHLWGIHLFVTGMLFGALMLVLYLTGFKRWNLLVGLTGAASIGVAVLVTRGVIAAPATTDPRLQGPAALVFGAGVVVAYGGVFALRAADFTWDARHSADVVRAGFVLGVSALVFLLLGVEIYSRAGSFDLSTLVNQTALPAFGVLLLLLASVAPTVSGMHSGALAVHSLVGWSPRAGAALIAAGSGVLGAARVDLHLLGLLGLLGAAMPPLIGVLLMHRSREASWHAWVSWGAGSGISLALLLAGYPASVLIGILTGAATMFVLGVLSVPAKERSHA